MRRFIREFQSKDSWWTRDGFNDIIELTSFLSVRMTKTKFEEEMSTPPYLIVCLKLETNVVANFSSAIKSHSPKDVGKTRQSQRKEVKKRLLKSPWLDELFDVLMCINFHSLKCISYFFHLAGKWRKIAWNNDWNAYKLRL